MQCACLTLQGSILQTGAHKDFHVRYLLYGNQFIYPYLLFVLSPKLFCLATSILLPAALLPVFKKKHSSPHTSWLLLWCTDLNNSSDNGTIPNVGILINTECQSASHLENQIHVKYLPQREVTEGTGHTPPSLHWGNKGRGVWPEPQHQHPQEGARTTMSPSRRAGATTGLRCC